MRARLRPAILVGAAGAIAAAAACNGLIGIQDRTLDPGVGDAASSSGGEDVGSSAGDATVTGDATTPADGATTADGATADATDAHAPDATAADADAGNPSLGPGDARTDVDSAANADAGDGGPAADGACTDVTGDPHNCGRCGHDCLGGACSAGVCQPVALVASDAGVEPHSLVQDDQFLYWLDEIQSTAYKTDKSTGGKTLLWQGPNDLPQSIAADDAGLYWGDFYGVWRCPKAGCALGPTFVSATPFDVYGLAVDDNNVYWADQDTPTAFVFSAPKNGFDAGRTTLWSSTTITPFRVATDGQKVYFAASDGFLHVIGVDGGAGPVIGAADTNGAIAVALNGSNVYWTVLNPGQGTIWGAPTTSLAAVPIAVQQFEPVAVASDGTSIYWLNFGAANNGVLRSCVIASCTNPATLATLLRAPRAVVVDDKAIYFTDEGNANPPQGSLWKLAK